MPLQHREYFELKAIKTLQIQENMLLLPQLPKFTQERHLVPEKELLRGHPFT